MNTGYDLETVNCPICNSGDYKIYVEGAKELYNNFDEYFDVCKCSKCGHLFTNPRPTAETIKYFYPDTAGYYKPVKYEEEKSYKYEVYKGVLNRYYGYRLDAKVNAFIVMFMRLFRNNSIKVSHMPHFIQNGKLLDIGCSYGAYLKKMKSLGWNVYGTEINEKAADYAINNQGIKNIEKCFFEKSKYEDNYFDVINMNMCLEHVYDLNKTIKKTKDYLKRNGQLLISVPDITGFEAKVYKQYAYTLQVPQHLNHFSPESIRMLLEKHGYRVENIVHHSFDRDLVASAGYMKNKQLSKVLTNPFVRKTIIKAFVLFLSRIGKTSRMSIYARKICD